MQNKAHLTSEGLLEIKQIKSGMNNKDNKYSCLKIKVIIITLLTIYFIVSVLVICFT